MNLRKDHYRTTAPLLPQRECRLLSVSGHLPGLGALGRAPCMRASSCMPHVRASLGRGSRAIVFFPSDHDNRVWCFERSRLRPNCEPLTTSNGGSLGLCIDEERSKMRYLVRIAEFSESSSL